MQQNLFEFAEPIETPTVLRLERKQKVEENQPKVDTDVERVRQEPLRREPENPSPGRQEEEVEKEVYTEPERENPFEVDPEIQEPELSQPAVVLHDPYSGSQPGFVLQYANRYERLGFRILPVMPRDKKPAINWKGDFPKTDVEWYWGEDSNLQANIGMRCDGFFVIDLDNKPDKGIDGIVNLDKALGAGTVERLKQITAWQTTGGNGLQFFFKLDTGIEKWLNNATNILGDDFPGIDCRFDTKGITVLPPSIHPSGLPYVWGNSPENVTSAPDWFLEKLASHRRARESTRVKAPIEGKHWRDDDKLLFDVDSFAEVKQRVFEHVMNEADARKENSSGFVNARVDSYDGEERLAIYASRAGIVGDWKGAPKADVLLALGIDPRVWLLQYDANDSAFAEAFYYMYGNRILWVPEVKQWAKLMPDMTWEFSRFETGITNEYHRLVEDWTYAWMRAERIRKERNPNGDQFHGNGKKKPSRGEFMLNWLKNLKNHQGMINRFKHLQHYNRRTKYAGEWVNEVFMKSRGGFDVIADHEFPARNGIVNLKSGDIRAYTPSDFITSRSSASYNPDVSTDSFEKELIWSFGGNLDTLQFVKRVAGYTITGSTNVQKLFVLYGESGRNGKSSFLDIISRVMGPELAVSTDINTLSNERESRYALAKMTGARLMSIREADVRMLNPVIVKKITGEEEVTARPIYGEPFSFDRKFKVWVATNEMPSINRVDGGIMRRLSVVPFAQIPDEVVNLDFLNRWRERQDVVLKWLIEGARDFYQMGIQEPESVQEFTTDIVRDMNTCVEFIRERLVFTDSMDDKITRKQLYAEYVGWSRDNFGVANSNKALFSALRTSYPKKYKGQPVEGQGNPEKFFRFIQLRRV